MVLATNHSVKPFPLAFFCSYIVLFFAGQLFAQNPPSNTEVFLADVTIVNGEFNVHRVQNISNNLGYDSQPWFSSDGTTLLYASDRNGETDIVSMSVWSLNKIWLTNTPNRSEYSPQFTPDGQELSYITLSPDGIQDFRSIPLLGIQGQQKVETIIESEDIIGYYHWASTSPSTYLCFVLPTDQAPATLQWHEPVDSPRVDSTDTPRTSKQILDAAPGRSFLPIPNTELLSFIDKQTDPWRIKSFNPLTGEILSIAPTLSGSEDVAWLPNGYPIMGSGSVLRFFNGQDWLILYDFTEAGIKNISRVAVNAKGEKIAIVGELMD